MGTCICNLGSIRGNPKSGSVALVDPEPRIHTIETVDSEPPDLSDPALVAQHPDRSVLAAQDLEVWLRLLSTRIAQIWRLRHGLWQLQICEIQVRESRSGEQIHVWTGAQHSGIEKLWD